MLRELQSQLGSIRTAALTYLPKGYKIISVKFEISDVEGLPEYDLTIENSKGKGVITGSTPTEVISGLKEYVNLINK